MSKDLVFGLSINPTKRLKDNENRKSFAPPESEDGSALIETSGYGSAALSRTFVLNLDAGVASEAELIEKYRTMALYSKIDLAIDEICNDAVVYEDDSNIVTLDLDRVDNKIVPVKTKNKLNKEFEFILGLMQFNRRGYEIFKRWYIDSRLAYHIMFDPERKKEGIKELRQLDPRKVKRIKEIERDHDHQSGIDFYKVVDDYYLYLEAATTYNKTFGGHLFGDAVYQSGYAPSAGQGIFKIAKDSIAFAHSGQVDASSGIIYGFLQKAIKPYNQLRMLEDALVIYRLARAPERRIFYIDTGSLPPSKSEFYVKQIQNRYRSKVVYDAQTGEVADQRRTLALQDDYWLPRREGSRGTQIETLPGGQNLGELDDVLYFKDELWDALGVPSSRFKKDVPAMFDSGVSITREELKFSKFITRIRNQFATIFHEILRVQLILKGILTEQEWDEIENNIGYRFNTDSYFAEIKEAEILSRRVALLGEVAGFMVDPTGFFDRKWVQKNVLRLSDEEIEEIDAAIEEEKDKKAEENPMGDEGGGQFGGGGQQFGGQQQQQAPQQQSPNGGEEEEEQDPADVEAENAAPFPLQK